MPVIKGINKEIMWGVFSPDGELQVRSLAYTMKQSKIQTVHLTGCEWMQYAAAGYTINKIYVDIKII